MAIERHKKWYQRGPPTCSCQTRKSKRSKNMSRRRCKGLPTWWLTSNPIRDGELRRGTADSQWAEPAGQRVLWTHGLPCLQKDGAWRTREPLPAAVYAPLNICVYAKILRPVDAWLARQGDVVIPLPIIYFTSNAIFSMINSHFCATFTERGV